jgi:hypothetical protein
MDDTIELRKPIPQSQLFASSLLLLAVVMLLGM